MTLIDRLDAAAGKTGISAIAMERPRPRRFRWLPILALLVGLSAWIAVLAKPWEPTLPMMALVIVQALAVWLPMAGPLKLMGGTGIADEFDRDRVMRSWLVGLIWIVFFAFTALLTIAGLALLLGWTRDMLLTSLIARRW